MGRSFGISALILLAALPVHVGSAIPAVAQQATAPSDSPAIDVEQLFATTCGWCHSGGGRVAGKGPPLMDSRRTDEFLRDRIKSGKVGAMPAFGEVFSDADIDAIVKYIRSLKPEQG